MLPLHRHVHLVMEKDTYKGLGNQIDIEKAWSLTRCIVGEEIFGGAFVAVPHIRSSFQYNQLYVFKKQRDLCRIRKPRYKIINNLDNLLNIELSTWIPQFDFSPWNHSDASLMYKSFRLKLESSPGEVLHKSIEILIDQPHIRSANPPVPGSAILLPESRSAIHFATGYFLYVITSVVLANFVKISVNIGEQENVYINTHTSPIGFKYRKYKILRDGTFNREIRTTLKYSDREAVWLVPTEESILRNPMWDPMGRRHDGRRPMRNILTLCTASYPTRENRQGNQAIFNWQIVVPADRNNNRQLPNPAGRENNRNIWQNPGLRQRLRNRLHHLPLGDE